jgi:hypothetical protein
MANAPKCSRCERELTDWQANVMVDSELYFEQHRIDHIFCLCKKCTTYLDDVSDGRSRYHNLWELKWLQQNFFFWFGNAMYNTTADGKVWSRTALLELCRIGAMLHPNEMNEFIDGFDPK